jgi:hypothetical protein
MGAELLGQVLADEKSAHMLVTEVAPHAPSQGADQEAGDQGRLTRQEWLYAHVMIFAIGAWNLFAVNLARTPGRWWFWPPVLAWAVALIVHGAWIAWTGKRPRLRTTVIRRSAQS